ncbi:GerAB/ArcD/ProY family transporter [Pelosinus sp. UFO1]|uniref:GerAB/ArcD/ProY family transporter n=1 Tax=Pelosinus sp. UFO1 TaxID=484770 RepID=UPI0004D0B9A4|nr:GerAB/ArcD/ProY family transporter [Pelosinus sp. UFO1]AIF50343.1 spore germination protein [Pelosinus sp. UFO1]
METKISAYQLFAIMVLLLFGSAILFFLTPEAKQDAWLALLIYIPVGIIESLLYTNLYYKYPNDTIVTYLPKIFGKFIGYILSVVYILYFTYLSARIVRDFSELILIVSLPELPSLIVSITIMVIFAYGAFAGIENISRAAQLTLPILMFFVILVFILLYATPDVVKMQNLKPVLENGISSVIKHGWLLITFPYGETIFFTMIYSSVNEAANVRKVSLLAVLFVGIILSLNTIMFIVSLGVAGASASLFPLFSTMRLIKLGFLERLDVFVIVIMIIGGFFKVSIITYAAMLGTSQLIKLKDPKYLAIPFGLVIVIFSIFIAKNYPEHIVIGLKWTPLYIHIPLQIIVPLTALMIHYIKRGKKKSPYDCQNKG